MAVNVSTLVLVVEFGANDAVTPLGRPDAARFTLPAGPFTPVTEILVVTDPPWRTLRTTGEASKVKLFTPLPLSRMLCAA